MAQDLEARVALLEEEVRRLQARVARGAEAVSGRTASDFLEQFAGVFSNDPTFDEAVRLGREWREQDKPPQDAK
jgi:hypothetical protein